MRNRYTRPSAIVGHIVVLAAALTCLRLGWWQWEVFEGASGDGQNLGYSLLWPVFSGSFIYMWLQFLSLEAARDAAEASDSDDPSCAEPADMTDDAVSGADQSVSEQRRRPASQASTPEVRTVGYGYIDSDDEDDEELSAYNRALAQLAEEDEHRG